MITSQNDPDIQKTINNSLLWVMDYGLLIIDYGLWVMVIAMTIVNGYVYVYGYWLRVMFTVYIIRF